MRAPEVLVRAAGRSLEDMEGHAQMTRDDLVELRERIAQGEASLAFYEEQMVALRAWLAAEEPQEKNSDA